MSNTIQVLDHGSVTLRNIAGATRRLTVPVFNEDPPSIRGNPGEGIWVDQPRPFDADDTDVANAARLSFEGQDQDRSYDQEMKLTHYLMKNKHMTPFESVVVWLEMKMPIFVARQFVRHRTQAINEASARYITLPAEWYIPETVGAAPKDKKQGQAEGLDAGTQKQFQRDLDGQCRMSYNEYVKYIGKGVAPEHARMFLHVNHYTHWMTTMNLRNLLGFLTLRDHPHAQIEAQLYARAIVQLLEPHLPGIMAMYAELKEA